MNKYLKFSIRYFYLIIIYMVVWAVSINHLFHQNKIYLEYNNMRGTVIDFSHFKTCNIATVKLQNGLIGEVNVGAANYKLGDQWTSELPRPQGKASQFIDRCHYSTSQRIKRRPVLAMVLHSLLGC
jgi:hypothetical protein